MWGYRWLWWLCDFISFFEYIVTRYCLGEDITFVAAVPSVVFSGYLAVFVMTEAWTCYPSKIVESWLVIICSGSVKLYLSLLISKRN